MLLCNGGNSLELKVVAYQFPSITEKAHDFDANWLIIEGKVRAGARSWSFKDPSLLTWEVGSLIEFLESLALKWRYPSEVQFVEPNLLFASESDGLLRVSFSQEATPPWLAELVLGEDEDFSIELFCSSSELIEAARSLREQLKEFPARAGHRLYSK
jgi:hypothetical protein